MRLQLLVVPLVLACFGNNKSDDDDDWSDDTGTSFLDADIGAEAEGEGEGEGDTDTDADADADADADDCEVESVSVEVPSSDGAMDFFYRDAVVFRVDGFDPGATISLAGGEDPVFGATAWNEAENRIHFQPADPLNTSTNYTATLSTCAGESAVSFFTSALGTPLEDRSGLVGNTYALQLDEGRFIKPEGVGALLSSYLESPFLFSVLHTDESTIELIGAIGREGESTQDTCEPTIDFPASDFDNPFFRMGPADTVFSLSGYDVSIDHLHFSGAFAPDGRSIGGGVFLGEIDTRDLAPLLGDDDDPDSICDLMIGFGVTCIECSSGVGEYCLEIEVDQLTSDLLPGESIVPIDGCDPDLCDECEGEGGGGGGS